VGGSWDRRKQARLALRLPLLVKGGSESAQFLERTATEQVSIGALYFRTQAWALMPVGARVFVAVGVPAEEANFGRTARIETVGRIVRVDSLNGNPATKGDHGVALELERSIRLGSWVDIGSPNGIAAAP
jgi:hypothetical protein